MSISQGVSRDDEFPPKGYQDQGEGKHPNLPTYIHPRLFILALLVEPAAVELGRVSRFKSQQAFWRKFRKA